MRIKTPSSIQHQSYRKSTLQIMIGFALSLMFLQVSAAEVTTETKPVTGNVNGSSNEASDFLKGSTPPAEPGYYNDGGIIRETDFSRETGITKETGIRPAGFSNKIILTTGVARDSNPSLVDTNKKPTWIYTFIPQVLLNYTGETNNLYLDGAILVQRHSTEEVLDNREDPRLSIGWDHTYEFGLFGLYANYYRISSRGEELRATGVFSGNNDEERTQSVRLYGARWEYNFAPRWSLLTNGEYSEETFSGSGMTLTDNSSVGVRSRLNYEYSERLDTYLQAGFTQIRPDRTFKDTDLSRIALGADYQLSEALRVSSRAGIYHLSGRQSDTDWEAGVQLRYDAGRVGYVAELNREVGVISAAFQKVDTFRLGWVFDMTELDKFSVNYTLSKFKRDAQANLAKTDTQEVSAFYDRILRGNWRGQANITLREQETGGSTSDGNVVGISLIYDGLSF